jgi:hypothetical protein
MECRNLREKLTAFVDEQLAPDEKKAVQEHLDTCPDCASHLEELRKTVAYARGLEGVEPPSWFTRKVMSKVREEAGRNKGILLKLFYPLHIKIPLEAAAMLVIVVTAFYVLRAVQPDVTVERPVSEAELSAPADRYDRDEGQRKETREGFAVPPAVHDEIQPEPAKESNAGRRTFADTYGAPVSRERAGEEQLKAFAGKSEEADESVILPQEKKAPKTAYRALDMEVKGKTEGVVPEGADAFVQVKEREYAFTLFAGDVQNSLKTIELAIEKLGGTILKDELPDDRNIIIAEITAGKISLLRESLQDLGSIQEEKAVESLSGRIRVKIEILQGQSSFHPGF